MVDLVPVSGHKAPRNSRPQPRGRSWPRRGRNARRNAAAAGLSANAAATAIVKRATADGAINPRVDVCRRLTAIRVVCHLVTDTGGQDRYVAYRGTKGRIRVAHRPILPPRYD